MCRKAPTVRTHIKQDLQQPGLYWRNRNKGIGESLINKSEKKAVRGRRNAAKDQQSLRGPAKLPLAHEVRTRNLQEHDSYKYDDAVCPSRWWDGSMFTFYLLFNSALGTAGGICSYIGSQLFVSRVYVCDWCMSEITCVYVSVHMPFNTKTYSYR